MVLSGWRRFAAASWDVLRFLMLLTSLGTLPFFISLYRSGNFSSLVDSDLSGRPEGIDRYWLKHFFVRLLVVAGICLAFGGIGMVKNSFGAAYLVIYGIAGTLVIAALAYSIEALVLLRKNNITGAAQAWL